MRFCYYFTLGSFAVKMRTELRSVSTRRDNIPSPNPEAVGCVERFATLMSFLLVILTFPFSLLECFKVVQEFERAVIFRLGRLRKGGARGPGLFFVLPCVDTYRKVDLRTVSFDVPPQETPDGMSLGPWRLGRPLVWDVTCVDTLAASHVRASSSTAAAAAAEAEAAKRRKYEALGSGFIFVPFGVETFGAWGPEARRFFKELSARLAEATGDPRAGSYLGQRISLAIQRGNAASILGTVPHAASDTLEEVLTRDSVTVAVDAVVYYRIKEPLNAVVRVADYSASTRLLAATTLRNVLGMRDLAQLLSDREAISHMMQANLDEATDPWGVEVERVEIKDVRLPVQLQRAMAAEAEADREARAKIIAAEGEIKASKALKEASLVMIDNPMALQLRYLQSLNTISAEKNSTIIFPFPMDFLKTFMSGGPGPSNPRLPV